MSHCPGYVGVTINDRMDMEEIFRYDTLIFCPTTFNLTFHIPNRGQRMDRTFEVIFEDSQKSYAVYLTHLLFSEPYSQTNQQAHMDSSRRADRWSFIVIIITSCLAALLVMNLMYAYLQLTKSRARHQRQNKTGSSTRKHDKYYQAAIKHDTQHHRAEGVVKKPGSGKQLTECQYLFIVCYVVFRVVYSLLFSFTVFLAILVVILESDTYTLQKIPRFQRLKHNETHHYAASIDKHAHEELLRQSELVTNMQGACSNYIQELFVSVQNEIENASIRAQYSQMYASKSSISWYVKELVDTKLSIYLNETENFTSHYYSNFTQNVQPSLHSYGSYLTQVFEDTWLQFPQDLFNQSDFRTSRAEIFQDSLAHGLGYDFGAFLEIEEVEQIQLWPVQWWERYDSMKCTSACTGGLR